ncbi:MAG: hypothetical protein WCA39_17640 [Nitrososphaeraceae archaeon]
MNQFRKATYEHKVQTTEGVSGLFGLHSLQLQTINNTKHELSAIIHILKFVLESVTVGGQEKRHFS